MEFLQNFDVLHAVLILIVTLVGIFFGRAWKVVAKEGKELIEKYIDAKQDGNITDAEWKAIAQEAVDVLVALGKALFKIDILKRFAKK